MPFVPSSPTRLYTFRRSRPLCPETSRHDPASSNISTRMGKLQKAQLLPTTSEADLDSSGKDVKVEENNSGAFTDSIIPISVEQAGKSSMPAKTDASTLAEDFGIKEKPKQKPISPTRSKPRYSFFDNPSNSEYSVDEDDLQIVIGRASSVRVSKPLIILHKHAKKQEGHGSDSDEASSQPGRLSTLQVASLATTAEEESSILPSGPDTSSGGKDFINQLSIQKGQDSEVLPTGNTIHSIHPTIITTASTEANPENVTQVTDLAISSPLPVPGKGLSRRVTIRPSDLVIKKDKKSASFREHIVTTPYPKLHESDSNSINSDNPKDNSSESTTAEPDQLTAPLGVATTFPVPDKDRSRAPNVASTRGRDRFPSPERSETLFLDLCLHRHLLARTTLEIQIPNKSTFNDEHFFTQIRAAYSKHLLGIRRWPFTLLRRISYITSSDTSDFNNIDFLKHLHNPRLGRKRKAWVIWLRNNNPRTAARKCALTPPTSAHIKTLHSLNELASKPRKLSLTQTVFGARRGSRSSNDNKSHHTEKNPVAEVDDHPVSKRSSIASDASTAGSFNFVYSPSIPRLPFLGQSQKRPSSPAQAVSPVRSFFWPNNLSSALNSSVSPSLGHANESGSSRIVTVSIQHEFRFGVVALLTFLVVVQAVVAALIWIIFGVPGSRPGMDGQKTEFGMFKSDWRIDARARILMGIVIGLVVFLVGCLGEGALVWGSWLLL